jgi:Ser/Thr protein kinase RdoA (MazF antagonist)
MPTLFDGWTDDPADPGRIRANDPRVRTLLNRIAPGEAATDLGGSFSLNLHLMPGNRVLRVHRPFVSRRRLRAEQALRQDLADAGYKVPLPLPVKDRSLLTVGTGSRRRWAELEPFLDTITPEPSMTSYRWLFAQMGAIHRVLATLPPVMPRSLAATWGTPDSLRRWLAVTRFSVASDEVATTMVHQVEALLPAIRQRWIAPNHLPQHLIHGDIRPGNIVRDRKSGETVLFDTGFADVRPRIWDIAYALGFMDLALNAANAEGIRADNWQDLLGIYEEHRGERLTPEEYVVLPAMAAIALTHTIAHAGYMADPSMVVRHERAFLQAAIHLLEA